LKRTFQKLGKNVLAGTMALSVLATPAIGSAVDAAPKGHKDKQEKHDVELRILGTTDIHTHLVNYDYYKDAETLKYCTPFSPMSLRLRF